MYVNLSHIKTRTIKVSIVRVIYQYGALREDVQQLLRQNK